MDDRIKNLLEYVRLHASANVAKGLERYIFSLEAGFDSIVPSLNIGDIIAENDKLGFKLQEILLELDHFNDDRLNYHIANVIDIANKALAADHILLNRSLEDK